jgi:proline dehydrogenase
MREDQLSEPSEELAARLLARVGFNDRFTATMVHPHTGPLPITAYSFQEVANLLNAPGLQVDLRALATWLDEIMGDEELATLTREAIHEGPQQSARSTTTALVKERLEQCRVVTEEDTDSE